MVVGLAGSAITLVNESADASVTRVRKEGIVAEFGDESLF